MKSLIAVLLLAVAPAHAAAEDLLGPARELYGAARYEDALSALNALRERAPLALDDTRSIEHYRALSFIALGRLTEADAALEAMVRADPLYQLGEADASPRVRTMFRDVRRRLLADIAVQEYTAAKAIYDRGDHVAAVAAFTRVNALLSEVELQGRLSDVRLLAQGFFDLSNAVVAASDRENAEASERAKEKEQQAIAERDDALRRTYTNADRQVTPPVAIAQALPPLPAAFKSQVRSTGLVEVIVSTAGFVESAVVRKRVHPAYDPLMLAAVANWRYKPATLNGVPVKYKKVVQVEPK